MRIDAHHHFWKYDPVEYDWISEEMSVIRRDFLSSDLQRELEAARLDGAISVQARQTLEETRWLLSMAREHDFIKAVVGWVPLIDRDVSKALEEFARERKFRAVRHVLQGEADDHYMLREDFLRGIARLKDFDLVYDILIFERHLPQTIQMVDKYPGQTFVLDHIAKPRIKENLLEPWKENMRALARRPNVYCKISGMVTEADFKAWTPGQMKPYFDVVLDAFGPARLMFGSDWPVCLVAGSYQRWHDLVASWACELSPGEQTQIFGGTAAEAYRLS